VVYNKAVEYLALIRNRNFTKLWLAQILSQVGQNLINFSLIILVFNLAAGSRFANVSVSLLVLSVGLPALLFASMAGVYVDYWDRRKVLVVTNILRGILIVGYVFVDGSLGLILLLTFIISIIMQFFIPAETATIPSIVPKKQLLSANGLFVFSIYASFILGYSGSGPAVRMLGEHGPYILVAAMMLLAALLTAFLPSQHHHRAGVRPPRPRLIKTIVENWRLIRERPDRFYSISQLTITQAIVSVLITLAPALSLALLHIPLQEASHILVIPVGVGMVLGVLLVNPLGKAGGKTAVIQAGLIIAACTLIALGLSGQFYREYHGEAILSTTTIAMIVAILMLILGLINALISATAQTLLQESTGDDNRGKVFASLNMMINLASTVPILLSGVLADLLSVTKVTIILGLLLGAYAIYMLRHYRTVIQART